MGPDRTIFDEPHHQSLELLAMRALANGNIPTAFKFADRRCRILPVPEPHCYVLRSEANFRMGATANAIADLAKALEIAPDDIAANRRMLAWAQGPQQRQAALALFGQERNFDVLRKAIQVLWQHGQRNFANVTVLADTIEGWAVWQDGGCLEISISNDADTVSEIYQPDPFHPLGTYGHATGFCVRRPRSATPQSIALSASGNMFHSVRTHGNENVSNLRVHWPQPAGAGAHKVTVIVPIYGDYDATRRCLKSLLRELNSSPHRAVLIEDATPDPRIAKYLAELESEPCVDVITNARNLGFVGSVNRAFDCITRGDIILLNADTIVPPGFINRLAAAARVSPDIGTVTPLSNNGELTNFPIPNKPNPLGSREDVERIDQIAATVNAGMIVDIPSGTGFCLYITRACLDAIGPFSEDFAPGYLEDADFCLRAHQSGFRNVCAPSVYVGHAGSKSFGPEKRSLVVRNLRVLEQRFPKHRMDCATFMAADPLRSAREAIERAAASIPCRPRLFVTGVGPIGAVARQRAREAGPSAEPAMIVEVQYAAEQAVVTITDAAGGIPQSLQFNLAFSSECELLMDFMKSLAPSRIEFLDPINTPFELVELLLHLKVPYDLFIADAGLLGPHQRILAAVVQSAGQFQIEKRGGVSCKTAAEAGDWTNRWWKIAEGAKRILVPCGHAEAFVAGVLPQRTFGKIDRLDESANPAIRKQRPATACHLGIVPVRSCAYEQRLISEIARELGRLRPDISISVIGATRDDIGLMRTSNAFVTGAVDPEEFEQLVDTLGVGHLFVGTTQPLFAHPILSVIFSSNIPTAYFDWSVGRNEPNTMDLAIDPRSSLDDIISALIRFMPEMYQGSGNIIGRGECLRSGQVLHAT
jgi:GT2 family glycosyltransferase